MIVDTCNSKAGRDATATSPERWVDEHGDYLYDYAMMRMHVPAAAQDAVQETFLAALRGQHSYGGLSAERAWLLGILKHKIYDYFRKTSRQPSFSQLNLTHDEDTGEFTVSGWHQGAWMAQAAPSDWAEGMAPSLDREAFWGAFYGCTAKLPRLAAQAFLMREMDELGSAEICHILGVEQNHLWVLLHRARLNLRRCLETNWFAKLNK